MISEEQCSLRERKKRQTRHDLHAAALRLAAEQGVAAVTVEAIADRAGVSARTFFNYFNSKDDALVGNAPQSLDQLEHILAAEPDDLDVRDVVRRTVARHLKALQDDGELWQLRRSLAAQDHNLGLLMLGAMTRLDRAIVAACITREARLHPEVPELDVAARAGAAMGAIRSAIRIYLDGGHDDLEALISAAYTACGWATDAETEIR